MIKFNLNILLIFFIIPLLACQKNNNNKLNNDLNSYINNFELLQENPKNDNSIRITSPRAIIDSINNDIEIIDSTIQILNKNGKDVEIKSGNSTLNNSKNLIRVFNNVNISLIESKNYFINTSSFNWDLNLSNIDLNNDLYINFNNSKIISSGGIYNIKLGLLTINDNIFKRSIYNNNQIKQYEIEILSDTANWLKDDNSIEFSSNDNQVITTVDFLSIK